MTRPAGGAFNEIKSNSHQTWTPTHCPRPPKAEEIRCIRRGMAAGDDFGTGTCVCDTEDSVRPGWLRAISGHPAQQLNFTRAGIRPHTPETALKGKGESRRTRFFGQPGRLLFANIGLGGRGGGAVPSEVKLVVEGRGEFKAPRRETEIRCRRSPTVNLVASGFSEVVFLGPRPGPSSRVKLSC